MMPGPKPSKVVTILIPLLLCAFLLVSSPALAQSVSVTSANPSSAAQGTINLNVTVNGRGFRKGAEAKWFETGTTNPGGVIVNSTAFVSSTQLTANITVSSTATVSSYDIAVANVNGGSGKGTGLFSVVQGGSGGGTCTSDISLQAIFAPGSNGNLIYGDSDFGSSSNTYYNSSDPVFNGGTIYSDGLDGADVKLQICNGTNDFVMNLGTGSTARFVNFAFTQQLSTPDPRTVNVADKTYQEGFFNGNEIANASLLPVGGSFNTCLGTSLSNIIKGETAHVSFNNPAVYEIAPGGTPGCTDGTLASIANTPMSTSIITVSHPDSCTWIITPQLDSTGAHRGGLVEQLKGNSYANGGQYNLPFAIKLVKLTCP
jgi:hypothetical protein